MKFCPHCGTTFEPGARFCLECGFDRTTVEQPEPQIASDPKSEVTKAEQKCFQCKSSIEPDDRFCPECGFDASAYVNPQNEESVQSEVDDTTPPPVEKPVLSIEDKQFCPQCGKLINARRFCENCGYDTDTSINQPPEETKSVIGAEETINAPDISEEPVPVASDKLYCPSCGSGITPGDRFCDECGFDTATTDAEQVTATPAETSYTQIPQPEPIIPPVETQAQPSGEPVNNPQAASRPSAPAPKKKKSLVWLLFTILGFAILAAGGWYGYNTLFTDKTADSADSIANTILPEPAVPVVVDSSNTPTEAIEQEEAAPGQPQTQTRPVSRIDQELAKQKAKQQKKPSQPTTTTPEQQPKTDMSVKVTSNTNGRENTVITIMEVGRKEDPKRQQPKNPAKLVIANPTMIVRITTDHYNNGMGTPVAGKISIKDRDGNLIGTYTTSGRSGTNGTPNSKWVAEPRKLLEQGTYYIWDSDFSTWSKTLMGSGFIVVEGYEVN